jgi:hypothetical protein
MKCTKKRKRKILVPRKLLRCADLPFVSPNFNEKRNKYNGDFYKTGYLPNFHHFFFSLSLSDVVGVVAVVLVLVLGDFKALPCLPL